MADPTHPDPALSSEASLLAMMLPYLRAGSEVEVGPGDDAAVVRLPSPRLVVTTDTLVEGHDFLPAATLPEWIGRKAAVQNLADVAAMGARPLALVSSLSAPGATPPEVFAEITRGLADVAEAHGAWVVGGDLGRAEQLVLTVTALGSLPEDQAPVRRDGGRPGDVLAIGAARLGRSAAGLALVLGDRVRIDDGRITLVGIADSAAAELVHWHDAPAPDLALGWGAGRTAHAMMDLSDGLVRDGGRIARASGVRIDVDPEALREDVEALAPLAATLGEDPWQWVLHGAEEHAMLAAFAPGEVPDGFRAIGRLHGTTEGGRVADVTLGGRPIPGTGFDHFG